MPPPYGPMIPQAPSTGPGMPPTRSYPRPTHPNQASQKPRIDPNQVPSPVAVREQDRQDFINEPYLTSSKKTVPLASTDFRAIDEGSYSCLIVITWKLVHVLTSVICRKHQSAVYEVNVVFCSSDRRIT